MSQKRCFGCMQPLPQGHICPHCGYDQRTSNAPHQLPAGTILREQYLIGKVLGQGGFGITYLGWDLYLDIPVAIKEYYPAGYVMRDSTLSSTVISMGGAIGERFRSGRERFLREGQALTRFTEIPQIVQMLSFFLSNDTAYLVMEYVNGITLRDYVRRKGGRLSPAETLSLLLPIMQALETVHQAGLVHRDVSPDNIMILPDGSPKLLDFGAVRNVEGAGQPQSTQAILKQGYAPIEQYQNKGNLGSWTDVYAMCATFFYCLTGSVPPEAPERLVNQVPLSLEKVLPKNALAYAAVLDKGMALPASERIQDMRQLRRELSRAGVKPLRKKKGKPFLLLIPMVLAAILSCIFLLGPREEPVPEAEETPVSTAPGEAVLTGDKSIDNRMYVAPVEADITYYSTNSYNFKHEFPQLAALPFHAAHVSRENIRRVTFLDTLEDAPENAADMSEAGNGQVLGWTEPDSSFCHLYIAGEGGVWLGESAAYFFAGCTNLEEVSFGGNLHTENAKDLRYFFCGCPELTAADLETLDTSSAVSLDGFFVKCVFLKELDLTSWDVRNVTSTVGMFQNCSRLQQIALTGWDTGSLTHMSGMFDGCSALRSLDISHFDTGNVEDMSYLFQNCQLLKQLNFSGWDTAKVTTLDSMFSECVNLQTLDLTGWNTANVTSMARMFDGCSSLKNLDVSHLNTAKVTTMNSLFFSCNSLEQLNLSSWDTSSVTDMGFLFGSWGNSSLRSLNLKGWDTGNVTNMQRMFFNCDSLRSVDVSHFDTAKVTDMSYMFMGCPAKPNISNWDMSSVTNKQWFQ